MTRLAARDILRASLFTSLLAVGALASLPLGSVPFTLQTLVVVLAGMVLGPRVAALSIIAYLALGLVAPVYAGGTSGLAVLFGPTGGYLWGFVPSVLVTGALAARDRSSLPWLVLAGLAGVVPIYALGAVWLAVTLDLSPSEAVLAGIVPFVWVDVVKAVAAALVARGLFSLPQGLPASPRGR